MNKLQRPRETWEGSRGPLSPTTLFNPSSCPEDGVHFTLHTFGGYLLSEKGHAQMKLLGYLIDSGSPYGLWSAGLRPRVCLTISR